VRDYGAKGDGVTLDTAALNPTVEECAKAGGGQVLLPPGCYLSGIVRLRSHVTLFLSAGATLAGSTNLADYSAPEAPSVEPGTRYGKWYRGLVIAANATDFALCGPGTIDGRKVFDPAGEERMRGPHAVTFAGCQRVVIRDLSILDAANYGIFFNVSDDVDVRNVKITGGWDGVHFRGTPEHWCHRVTLASCLFYTGDDSIAGDYWDKAVITGCTVNSSCNGLRLIGPARHLIVDHCLFYGPGEQPHRSSGRVNMLSGIILQPGAWDRTRGELDDVLLSHNTMRDVSSPVTLWTRPGNPVGTVTVAGLEAIGVGRAAFSAESWSDAPITNLVLRGVHVQYRLPAAGTRPAGEVRPPGVDIRPLPAWGAYLRNVDQCTMEEVRFSVDGADLRPVVAAESVKRLSLDGVHFTRVAGVTNALSLSQVGRVDLRGTDFE